MAKHATTDLVTGLTVLHPETALDIITETYAPSRLDVLGSARDFNLKVRVSRLPGLAFGKVQFGTDVRVTALPPSCYVLCLASEGSLDVTSGRSTHVVSGSRGVIIYPHEPTYFENWAPGTELITVRIDTELLERQLVQMLGRPVADPLKFHPEFDLSNGNSAALGRALEMLRIELTQADGIAQNLRGAALLTDVVTTSLVLSQPNNFSDLIHRPAKACPIGPLRDAQELIEEDPMAFTTVGDMAERVHSSVRSLEEGFRKHLDTTPMAYLRQVRLTRARSDLQIAEPSTHTVARVANRWGFKHLGRFASIYRDCFGELPAETLKTTHR
ncbi:MULTISPECIES: AraC family transcriptional regulator [unclassified Rhodococcus (in: high G+C Gram-positive bacteria)]|uniref:AraC family transcriptional regulator n=1 Tax=unclassified Rhodococcus (in: high G+C Gram-positive bacteria) TaxID=192944 RepID=UPI000927CAD2|nr:AraC family transcriptional regulator [Rhodococcus sp. M8]OLL20920.1 AraC family transcriptional regulator [Rhodococcus sp. M8]QPG44767.1 AraC family transcriptional regulator [Rhodococcus sp. M8]